MKVRHNISLKERRSLQINDFKGVDLSSSPLRVAYNRASESENFTNEYGVNRKRNGWKELVKIEHDGIPQQINNFFVYVNNQEKQIILHAGKRFYRLSMDEANDKYSYIDITDSSTYAPAKVDENKLLDEKSQAFFNNGRAYIIGCGDYLVYGTWDDGDTYELRRVCNDVDTYIPTTTISIDEIGIADTARATLDQPNLLTRKRKNTLVGKLIEEGSEESATYRLDSKIGSGKVYITMELYYDDGDEIVTLETEVDVSEDVNNFYFNDYLAGYFICSEAKIVFNAIPGFGVANQSNITVTFEADTEENSEHITKCKFGTVFNDYLFLSGNTDFPNIDFHTDVHAISDEYLSAFDFTYFGQNNVTSFGSDSSAVKGYLKVNDDSMVIFKDENAQESTIFTRRREYQSFSDGTVRYIYPITAGAVGESVVSRHTIANFLGDNIFLSNNGVYGLALSNNVAVSDRYVRERSRLINKKLSQYNLSEATSIVFGNKYYLSVDNVCFVADSRFKYTGENDIDGSYNYEWWFWTNIPARVFANISNELYFGTKDGCICKFDDKYTDRTFEDVSNGAFSVDFSTNKIVCAEDLLPDNNDVVKFKSDDMYALVDEGFRIDDSGRILTSEEKIMEIHEQMEVYADNVGESGLSVDKKYYISRIDYGDCSYALIDEEKNKITLQCGGFRLHKKISQKDLCVTNSDVFDSKFQLKEYEDGKVLVLTNYNEASVEPSAKFVYKSNVVAKWYTPVFDLGTVERSKTLLKMIVSTEPGLSGSFSFGYETRGVRRLIEAKGINAFSFDDLAFDNFSFDTDFASSYSVKVNERNFNFIIFRFVSDSDTDCSINSFSAIYKINKSNIGVR